MDDDTIIKLAQQQPQAYMADAMAAHLGYIIETVNKYWVASMSYEDMMSEAKIPFVKAVYAHDPDKARFITLLNKYMSCHFLWKIKHQQNKQRWKYEEACDIELVEEPHIEPCIVKEEFWPIPGLKWRYALVLELRYVHDMTLAMMARVLGVCGERARQLIEQALQAARKILKVGGIR